MKKLTNTLLGSWNASPHAFSIETYISCYSLGTLEKKVIWVFLKIKLIQLKCYQGASNGD